MMRPRNGDAVVLSLNRMDFLIRYTLMEHNAHLEQYYITFILINSQKNEGICENWFNEQI